MQFANVIIIVVKGDLSLPITRRRSSSERLKSKLIFSFLNRSDGEGRSRCGAL